MTAIFCPKCELPMYWFGNSDDEETSFYKCKKCWRKATFRKDGKTPESFSKTEE
jgi:hypothetical protein